jgi:hypothetical protein
MIEDCPLFQAKGDGALKSEVSVLQRIHKFGMRD